MSTPGGSPPGTATVPPPPTCWPARTGALARFLGHQDKEQENTDGGEA
ncbi:hypothetical protein ACFW9N_39890 [Streptomyces sp. NPDC059496]